MQDESKYPSNVKVELARLRDANRKLSEFISLSNSQNPSISSEIVAFDIKNATIVDDETGQVVNNGSAMTRSKANTSSEKLKDFAKTNKYWLIGGVVFIVIVVLGVVYYYKKRR